MGLKRAEGNTAPTEKLSDEAKLQRQVRRAPLPVAHVLVGAVLDGRVEELCIRGPGSHTPTWMASGGG
jgi:hypothetical protein